jgi:hypothetical protein
MMQTPAGSGNAARSCPVTCWWHSSDKLWGSVALYCLHYNFCKLHKTIRVTTAMEAGIADHIWEIEEILTLLD